MTRKVKPSPQSSGFDGPEFKRLRAKWYAKLAAEGFEDIEDDRENLKADTSRRRMEGRPEVEKLGREAYYTRARHHLFGHHWESPRERLVWALHCQGLGIRAIINETSWGFGFIRDSIRRQRVVMEATLAEEEDSEDSP